MESPVGQAIGVHGTDEQRARLRAGRYCVGFAEAAHGSDLAAVETRGDIAGDEVVVTGAKVWLAHADAASAALVLCCTEPAASRYRNLSCVLVPLQDNNVELRPLRTMTGDIEFFEAVFDGARAPADNIIGGRGNGWRVAMTTLGFARIAREMDPTEPSTGAELSATELEREFWDLVATAQRHRRADDPLIRQQLAAAYAQMRTLQLHTDAETTSLLWGQYRQRLGELGVEIMGADAMVRPDGDAYATSRWQHALLSSPGEALANGTQDIQRTTVAERVLGLPQ